MAYFTTLYSGSSGNCGVVWCDDAYLLIDVGKGIRITEKGLKALQLAPANCRGVLVTHTHSDHVGGLAAFLAKYPVPVYAIPEVRQDILNTQCAGPEAQVLPLEPQGQAVGEFTVSAFPTSHDVPCCGFRITCADGRRMAIATDLGCLTPAAHAGLSDAHLTAIEANYDRELLRSGPYPPFLKQRILGRQGHLSNDECAAKILELAQQGCTRFALCHMSKDNNSVQQVLATVRRAFLSAGVQPGPDTVVQVMERNAVSPVLQF